MSRIYTITKPALKNQYTITGPGRDSLKNEQVFARLRPAIGKSPFIVIHDGPDAEHPIVAVSHLPPFPKHFKIGLGGGGDDDEDRTAATNKKAQDMHWEELHMEHSSGKKHTWAMDIASEEGGQHRGRIALVWTRTRSVVVDGMTRPPLSTRNWKLTETSLAGGEADAKADSGVILAIFTTTTQMGKCGNLQINVDHGREFDLMVWVTCLSLYSSGR